jgi:predicted metal-dependent phosphoesterase TrpH
MRVDFHVHSTASDGTLTPIEVFSLAQEKKCSFVSLTDHDETGGLSDFLSQKGEVATISGVELSVEPGEGFDRFHLLGLGMDHTNKSFVSFLEKIRLGRDERNKRIIENFRQKGIELEDEVRQYATDGVLARPHFARWLVDHGMASSIPEAFSLYLLDDSPKETKCYASRIRPSRKEAFDVIHAAGGVCIMAHPKYLKSEWKRTGCDYEAAKRALGRFKEEGLDGVEALYQANTPEENVEFTRMADSLGLLKSAGSDFHGENKPSVTFGMEVEESFIRPLLERFE